MEKRRRESVENQLLAIREEEEEGNVDDFGTVISRDFGNGGIRSTFQNNRRPALLKKVLAMLRCGGPKRAS